MTSLNQSRHARNGSHAAASIPDGAAGGAALPWMDRARRFIVDLDGTLVRERRLIPGAVDLLERLGDRYVIVSNNSTDTAFGLAKTLVRLGLPVETDR
jgi:ribonucleotide monophosphatase NagD (HAD superfamily)